MVRLGSKKNDGNDKKDQKLRFHEIFTYPYIDHFQSMTIFFVIDHGQWQFFCHWPGSMTLFWALSISFCHWLWSMTYGHKWYVHKVEWFSALSNSQWDQGCQKIVIDQSMTIFCDNRFLIPDKGGFKIVINRSMTLFKWRLQWLLQNCHWLVNDNFLW